MSTLNGVKSRMKFFVAAAVLGAAVVGFDGDALAQQAAGSGSDFRYRHTHVCVSWVLSARDDLSFELLLLRNDM